MRIRNKQQKRELYQQMQEEFVQNPAEYKGKWSRYFGRIAPLHAELGTGRGQFISTQAAIHPDVNYIGIEKYPEVIIRALQKKQKRGVGNLALICFDATEILDIFGDQELDRIYLNFSDPWPKKKNADKRLTARLFLDKYRQVLKPGGDIQFKTDNQQLFEFSLNSLADAGWRLRNMTFDLHNSPFEEGNVMTEYEEKFIEKGTPIYRLEASHP